MASPKGLTSSPLSPSLNRFSNRGGRGEGELLLCTDPDLSILGARVQPRTQHRARRMTGLVTPLSLLGRSRCTRQRVGQGHRPGLPPRAMQPLQQEVSLAAPGDGSWTVCAVLCNVLTGRDLLCWSRRAHWNGQTVTSLDLLVFQRVMWGWSCWQVVLRSKNLLVYRVILCLYCL